MAVTPFDPLYPKPHAASKLHGFFLHDIGLDSYTFIYELDPYSLWMYRVCENELPTSRLSESYRLTNRQTDTVEITHNDALWVVSNVVLFMNVILVCLGLR